MQHQDWKPVVLRKDDHKTFVQHSSGHKKIQDLDSDDPSAPKTLSLSAGKQIQQRCLARAIAPDDGNELALVNGQAEIPDGPFFIRRALIEDFADLFKLDHLARFTKPLSRPPALLPVKTIPFKRYRP